MINTSNSYWMEGKDVFHVKEKHSQQNESASLTTSPCLKGGWASVTHCIRQALLQVRADARIFKIQLCESEVLYHQLQKFPWQPHPSGTTLLSGDLKTTPLWERFSAQRFSFLLGFISTSPRSARCPRGWKILPLSWSPWFTPSQLPK